jgi:hypothetical protein
MRGSRGLPIPHEQAVRREGKLLGMHRYLLPSQ